MKSVINTLSIAILTLFPTAVSAGGHGAGNGGNVAVCFNSSETVKKIKTLQNNQISKKDLEDVKSIQALDLYSALAQYKPGVARSKLILPTENESYIDFTSQIINRFKEVMPNIASDLESHKSQVLNESNFRYYTEGGLERIYDAGEGYYLDPETCVIATAIRQMNVSGEIFLEFDERLMSHPKHSEMSRTLLAFHEVVYHWGLYSGHTDSSATQRLIGVMLRKDLSSTLVNHTLSIYEFKNTRDTFYKNESPELWFLSTFRYQINKSIQDSKIIDGIRKIVLDNIPEEHRPFYENAGGGWRNYKINEELLKNDHLFYQILKSFFYNCITKNTNRESNDDRCQNLIDSNMSPKNKWVIQYNEEVKKINDELNPIIEKKQIEATKALEIKNLASINEAQSIIRLNKLEIQVNYNKNRKKKQRALLTADQEKQMNNFKITESNYSALYNELEKIKTTKINLINAAENKMINQHKDEIKNVILQIESVIANQLTEAYSKELTSISSTLDQKTWMDATHREHIKNILETDRNIRLNCLRKGSSNAENCIPEKASDAEMILEEITGVNYEIGY
ncbi:MAG: hypothetical protein KA715_09020 [Xanthomonadaceae bacterium]|nr:hypothetical protein [Xanthomonadaceae bacterium]